MILLQQSMQKMCVNISPVPLPQGTNGIHVLVSVAIAVSAEVTLSISVALGGIGGIHIAKIHMQFPVLQK